MKKSNLLKVAAVALTMALAAGCASTDQLTKMEADIANAQSTADAAMAKATDAMTKADAAMDAANAAQAAADECSERCSRIMEKAMSK